MNPRDGSDVEAAESAKAKESSIDSDLGLGFTDTLKDTLLATAEKEFPTKDYVKYDMVTNRYTEPSAGKQTKEGGRAAVSVRNVIVCPGNPGNRQVPTLRRHPGRC